MSATIEDSSITIHPPSSARAGEQISVSVDFKASFRITSSNIETALTLIGQVSDSAGQLSGRQSDQKSLAFGRGEFQATVQSTATYQDAGTVTIYAEIKVYDSSASSYILDRSESRIFNVTAPPTPDQG